MCDGEEAINWRPIAVFASTLHVIGPSAAGGSAGWDEKIRRAEETRDREKGRREGENKISLASGCEKRMT